MPPSAQLSSSSVARDVLWERTLGTLLDVLRSALCAAGLDDPWVLCEYPTESWQNVEENMGGKLETGGAPSGAATSRHLSSPNSTLLSTGPSGTGSGWPACVGDTGTGGVPKTDQATFPESLCGAYVVEEKGGDPRTVHASSVDLQGGDPTTDHASLCAQMLDEMAATCSPYRPGGLATQTATDPASPGLNPDFAVSSIFAHGFPEHRDGLPSLEEHPDFRDQASHFFSSLNFRFHEFYSSI